jgi:H+/Cl- antiporter ClcA
VRVAKSFLTEYRLELSSFLSLLFGVLTVIGVVGAFFRETKDDGSVVYNLHGALSFLVDLARPFGPWGTWLVVAAPIGLIICVWWLYDYVKKIRELAELIDTPSKAKFVRNLDDIEYLAWSLPQRYENTVLKKKREFKI